MDPVIEKSLIIRALVKSKLIGEVSLAAPVQADAGKYSLTLPSQVIATGQAAELLSCIDQCAGDVKSLQSLCEKAGLIKPSE